LATLVISSLIFIFVVACFLFELPLQLSGVVQDAEDEDERNKLKEKKENMPGLQFTQLYIDDDRQGQAEQNQTKCKHESNITR